MLEQRHSAVAQTPAVAARCRKAEDRPVAGQLTQIVVDGAEPGAFNV
jgi:hypothetical protein